MNSENLELATLAGGCFWCTEAVFQRLNGVEQVLSGFTGGNIKNPAYREIITGRTGHAEAIQIRFNSEVISFKDLLYVFFATHDPTTLNRQQNDVGTQYRSAVFYHSDAQKQSAEKVIGELEEKGIFDNKIVTEISAVKDFYTAEKEHQDFYNQHRQQPYCQFIIDPKIKKLTEVFSDKLKQEKNGL